MLGVTCIEIFDKTFNYKFLLFIFVLRYGDNFLNSESNKLRIIQQHAGENARGEYDAT